jgi:hypothetical protein
MVQWEYKIISFGINLSALLKIARWDLEIDGIRTRTEADTIAYIDQLGSEGWELISTGNGTDHAGNITKFVCFFKRQKQAAPVTPGPA